MDSMDGRFAPWYAYPSMASIHEHCVAGVTLVVELPPALPGGRGPGYDNAREAAAKAVSLYGPKEVAAIAAEMVADAKADELDKLEKQQLAEEQQIAGMPSPPGAADTSTESGGGGGAASSVVAALMNASGGGSTAPSPRHRRRKKPAMPATVADLPGAARGNVSISAIVAAPVTRGPISPTRERRALSQGAAAREAARQRLSSRGDLGDKHASGTGLSSLPPSLPLLPSFIRKLHSEVEQQQESPPQSLPVPSPFMPASLLPDRGHQRAETGCYDDPPSWRSKQPSCCRDPTGTAPTGGVGTIYMGAGRADTAAAGGSSSDFPATRSSPPLQSPLPLPSPPPLSSHSLASLSSPRSLNRMPPQTPPWSLRLAMVNRFVDEHGFLDLVERGAPRPLTTPAPRHYYAARSTLGPDRGTSSARRPLTCAGQA